MSWSSEFLANMGTPIHLAETTTTQRVMEEAWRAEPVQPGTSFIADHQTAGRGRLDRTWVEPPRSSLLVSTLVAIPEAHRLNLGWVTSAAALAARAAVATVAGSDRPLIKWPNDLVYRADSELPEGADLRGDRRVRKLGGLLAQFLGERDGQLWICLGCGLNITQTADQLLPTATSVFLSEPSLAGRDFFEVRDALYAEYRAGLASRLAAYDDPAGPAARLIGELQNVSADIDRQITVRIPENLGGGSVTGVARRILADGSLELDTASGIVTVAPGDVAMLAKESND